MTENLFLSYAKDEKSSQKSNWTPYNEDDENDNENNSMTEDRPSDNAKEKSKKKYSVIPQNVREKFIKRVLSKEVTIKEAAKEFGLKFSTSKAILQTYKKEGRIGKKKNRERKTKVVNAVFISNIHPGASFFPTTGGPLNEIKNINLPRHQDFNFSKLMDQESMKLSDPKFPGAPMPNGYNKAPPIMPKEFGNEFLRDFIKKNYTPNIPPPNLSGLDKNLNFSQGQDQGPLGSNFGSSFNTTTLPSLKNFINFGNNNNANQNKMNPSGFGSFPNLNSSSILIPQKVSSVNSEASQLGGFAMPGMQNKIPYPNTNQMNQKRSFQAYEKDQMYEFGNKNDQINDISVKKFKSGEDIMWDLDLDKSKKDLEDFIYKTHNSMKNSNLDEPKILDSFGDFP